MKTVLFTMYVSSRQWHVAEVNVPDWNTLWNLIDSKWDDIKSLETNNLSFLDWGGSKHDTWESHGCSLEIIRRSTIKDNTEKFLEMLNVLGLSCVRHRVLTEKEFEENYP